MSHRNKSRLNRSATAAADPTLTPVPAAFDPESARRRRRRRWWFVLATILAGVGLEGVSYSLRSITITLVNRCDVPLHRIKVDYTGGSFAADALEPGESLSRVVRPQYAFSPGKFSTYETTIRFGTPDGSISGHRIKVWSFDYSARETFTIRPATPEMPITLDRTTEPGFPLGQIRRLMVRAGLR